MKSEAIFNATQPLVIIVPLFFCIVISNYPVPFGLVSFGLMIFSVILLFYARLPLYRRGEFFKMGPSAIEKARLKWYYASYVCLFISIIMALLTILRLKL